MAFRSLGVFARTITSVNESALRLGLRNPLQLGFNFPAVAAPRLFTTSPYLSVKKIHVEETEKGIILSAEYIESPKIPTLIKNEHEKDNFLRPDGCLLPRRITGLCWKQQKRIKYLVAMAQKAGLMPNFAPANSKRDPKRRYGSKKYNRYYDEATIEPWLKPTKKIVRQFEYRE